MGERRKNNYYPQIEEEQEKMKNKIQMNNSEANTSNYQQLKKSLNDNQAVMKIQNIKDRGGYLNIPKRFKEELDWDKGDMIIVTLIDNTLHLKKHMI